MLTEGGINKIVEDTFQIWRWKWTVYKHSGSASSLVEAKKASEELDTACKAYERYAQTGQWI